jgi:hypothetical protein
MLPSPFIAWGSVLSAFEVAGNKKGKIKLKYAFFAAIVLAAVQVGTIDTGRDTGIKAEIPSGRD